MFLRAYITPSCWSLPYSDGWNGPGGQRKEAMPIKKIVVIGPESTGKSTLCSELAAHYQTDWVPELCPGIPAGPRNKLSLRRSADDREGATGPGGCAQPRWKGVLRREVAMAGKIVGNAIAGGESREITGGRGTQRVNATGGAMAEPLLFIDTDMYVMERSGANLFLANARSGCSNRSMPATTTATCSAEPTCPG